MSTHSLLSGLDLHEPYHFVQEADPGAVGAHKYWLKVSEGVVKRRNDANTDWITIGGSAADYAIRDATNTFTATGNNFTQGLTVTTTGDSAANFNGSGTVNMDVSGAINMHAAGLNFTGPTTIDGDLTYNGKLILTQAITSLAAIGVIGLTGGGATNLDGITSAGSDGRIVIFFDGTNLQFWMLFTGVWGEDGINYIQPDDDGTKTWIKLG